LAEGAEQLHPQFLQAGCGIFGVNANRFGSEEHASTAEVRNQCLQQDSVA
jgi:hypothetical protein